MEHTKLLIHPLSTFMQAYNSRARVQNRHLLDTTVHQSNLIALQKDVPGMGAGLPGHPMQPPHVQDVAVGTVPPGFPPTGEALLQLTHPELSRLSEAYNDDFGIVATDGHAARVAKLRSWVSG